MYSLPLLSMFSALLLASFLLVLPFGAKISNSTSLRNVPRLLLDYTVLIFSQPPFPSDRKETPKRPSSCLLLCAHGGRQGDNRSCLCCVSYRSSQCHTSQSAAPTCDVARTSHKSVASFKQLAHTYVTICVWVRVNLVSHVCLLVHYAGA
jgi:hypothetical protein